MNLTFWLDTLIFLIVLLNRLRLARKTRLLEIEREILRYHALQLENIRFEIYQVFDLKHNYAALNFDFKDTLFSDE